MPIPRILLSAAALAAVAGATAAAPFSSPRRNTVTVTVTFMCDGKRSVDPWEAHVKQGDEIAWELTEDSDATRFRIKPKRSSGWPLSGGASPEGDKEHPGRGTIRPDARKGRSGYDIEARCGTEWKRIDPDIIVD